MQEIKIKKVQLWQGLSVLLIVLLVVSVLTNGFKIFHSLDKNAAKEKTQTGLVIAVGAGRLDKNGGIIPLQVKKGDTVFFGKYAGTEADREHLIIREEEILGVVEQ